MFILQNTIKRFCHFQPRTQLVISRTAMRKGWIGGILLMLLAGINCAGPVAAQTGTFIDRYQPHDLRVVSFNVWLSNIVPSKHPAQAEKFVRIVNALDPDILNLQEAYFSPSTVVSLLNNIAPLDEGTWHAHKGRGNVIASKYPLSMQATSIDSLAEHRSPAIAMVDLPNEHFLKDFYVINHHLASGLADPARYEQRQRNADATIRWIRNARMPGGTVDLPPRTPIAVVGDFNNKSHNSGPLRTIVTGDIFDESTYGPDFPSDWDSSPLTEAYPSINGEGSEHYTFRYGLSKSRIDHIIYSDSVLNVANKFVLNTVDMSPAELVATGLETFDVTIDSVGDVFDHLPVVADFRMVNDLSYMKTNGDLEWILYSNGDTHTYSGNNLQSGANLDGANLDGANLQWASLSNADLSNANLSGTNLVNADLTYANLTGANLEHANLESANLNLANLQGALLAGTELRKADLNYANLNGTTLQGTDLAGTTLTGANLTGANLTGANLSRTTFTDVDNWNNASWENAFYYTNNDPIWTDGMDQAWRDLVGILMIDPTTGDFNGDGITDAADYTIWQDNFGLASSILSGNGSGEATVMQKDYIFWKATFPYNASASALKTVPEPPCLLLILSALATASLQMRRR